MKEINREINGKKVLIQWMVMGAPHPNCAQGPAAG